MEHQILVPLDGSETATAALPHAAALARGLGRSLALLRVIPSVGTLERMVWPTGVALANPIGLEETLAQARADLRACAAPWQAAGLPVTTEVRQGDPATTILACAEQRPGVDLIAMTTHGRGGVGRWLLGSVAERVLAHTPVPLLLGRAPAEATPPPPVAYRTILVPLDGSVAAELALGEAERVAQATGASLLLLSVTLSPTMIAAIGMDALWLTTAFAQQDQELAAALDATARRVTAPGLVVRTAIRTGDPATEILAACAEEHADLIVMSTQGRSGLDRVLLGSVALKVVRHASLPVLLVRALIPPPPT
jgi:nucleotide-binding universal stress UspA family protein